MSVKKIQQYVSAISLITSYGYASDSSQESWAQKLVAFVPSSPMEQVKWGMQETASYTCGIGGALPFLVLKNMKQRQETILRQTVWEKSVSAYRAHAPLLGASTIMMQGVLMKQIRAWTSSDGLATMGTALCSAPMLALFNGVSSGDGLKKSLKTLRNYRVTGATAAREGLFSAVLFSNTVNEGLDTFSDKTGTGDHGKMLAKACLNALLTQPLDTYISRCQNHQALNMNLRLLYAGAVYRTAAVFVLLQGYTLMTHYVWQRS